MFHTIEEAIRDLKQGKVIIVVDDENRENEGDFVALAEYATPDVINFMASHGRARRSMKRSLPGLSSTRWWTKIPILTTQHLRSVSITAIQRRGLALRSGR